MNSDPAERRVLIVVPNPLGGIRTYLLYNGFKLTESGYRFTFLAPEGQAFEIFKEDTRDWPHVEYVDAPVRKGRCRFQQIVRQTLKRERFALIHSQGLRAGTEVAIADYFGRLPHVMTLHDTRHDAEFSRPFGPLKKRIIAHFSARINVIVAVSHDCADNHLQYFPLWRRGPCKIEVIHNGVDLGRLHAGAACVEGSNSIRRQLNLSDDVVLAGYFGRFMPEKGFLVLLEAMRLLASRGYQDTLRLIATKDPFGYRGEYMREVASDPTLSKMVCFVEPVSNIGLILPQVDMLVMPSLWEAYGLLAAEAMALGVPVVGSDAIGLREVLHGTPASAPAAGDPLALAEAIDLSIRSDAKRCMSAFASLAQQRFDNALAATALTRQYDLLTDTQTLETITARPQNVDSTLMH